MENRTLNVILKKVTLDVSYFTLNLLNARLLVQNEIDVQLILTSFWFVFPRSCNNLTEVIILSVAECSVNLG